MRYVWILTLTLVLAACSFSRGRSKKPKPQFVAAEYAPYATAGTSAVVGQAFLKTRGGDVKYGAGNKVTLTPVTSYSTPYFESGSAKLVSPSDPNVEEYTWSTIGDGEGRFVFEGLPPGEYYVACWITWLVPYGKGTRTSGGVARRRITVGPDEVLENVIVYQSG